MIPDPEPERRQGGEPHHPGVAGRELRRLGHVAEDRVAARGPGVVTRVALEVAEEALRHEVVAACRRPTKRPEAPRRTRMRACTSVFQETSGPETAFQRKPAPAARKRA